MNRALTSTLRIDRLAAILPRASDGIARRLVHGGFWSLVGDAGARVLAFATAIAVARLLGVAAYGEYTLVQSTLAALVTIAQFGLGATATRYVAAARSSEPDRLGSVAGSTLLIAIVTGAVSAAALIFSAPSIAVDHLRAPDLVTPLRLASSVLLLSALSGTLSGIALGFEAFRSLARIAWVSALATFAFIVLGTALDGVRGAVIGLFVAEVIRCALLGLSVRAVFDERGPGRLRVEGGEIRSLSRFAMPILLGSILHAPVLWLCQGMIARTDDGLHQIGLYDSALKWMTVVILVPFAVSVAFTPVLSSFSASDAAAYRRATLRLAAVQFGLTLVPAAAVAALAPWLAAAFGKGFSEAAPVIRVLMIVAPLFVLKHLYWQALTSAGHAWASMWISALWAAVAMATTWMYSRSGAIGLAWAMLTSYGAALVASAAITEWLARRPRAT